MAVYFINTNENIILCEKDEEHIRNKVICHWCGKNFESEKNRDHCHLTAKYRGPAHNRCNLDVLQKQIIFYTLCIS